MHLGLPQISNFMCMKTVFTGTTNAINSVSLPYTVTATVGGAGSSTTNQTSNVWYGPVATVASNNIVSYSVNIKVPARTGSLCIPSRNIYGFGSVVWDMDLLGLSCGDLLGGWIQAIHC